MSARNPPRPSSGSKLLSTAQVLPLMPKSFSFFTAALFTAVLVTRASADTDAVIAKARAYLGPDATLEAITSIHYVGTLAGEEIVKEKEGKEIKRPFMGEIDLIFQKPY